MKAGLGLAFFDVMGVSVRGGKSLIEKIVYDVYPF